mmetsp:Transcript_18137/g.22274  ORF Transcript_18137/g.22274 Transcript_18137/m.22274 type:complete len:216 (-) Transcript_18137:543-1190(-)
MCGDDVDIDEETPQEKRYHEISNERFPIEDKSCTYECWVIIFLILMVLSSLANIIIGIIMREANHPNHGYNRTIEFINNQTIEKDCVFDDVAIKTSCEQIFTIFTVQLILSCIGVIVGGFGIYGIYYLKTKTLIAAILYSILIIPFSIWMFIVIHSRTRLIWAPIAQFICYIPGIWILWMNLELIREALEFEDNDEVDEQIEGATQKRQGETETI